MPTTTRMHFWKMHGAGNDFIVFVSHPALNDARLNVSFLEKKSIISKLCHRNTGIGADGVIFILHSHKADFKVRFFNSDGSEADMCGNGVRCAAMLAADLKIARKTMLIETAAGIIQAQKEEQNNIRLYLLLQPAYKLNIPLRVNRQRLICHFVNTGVPHVILETKNLKHLPLMEIAPAIRYHKKFQPAGTNVDFIKIENLHKISIRTYERGVENETLACGTGVMASAIAAGLIGKAKVPIKVKTASGDVLEVNYSIVQDKISNLTLKGKAVVVYEGKILSSFFHK